MIATALLAASLAAAGSQPSCAQARHLRSVDAPAPDGGPTRHGFQNASAVPLTLFWIDREGKRVPLGTLAPRGGFQGLQTYVGHVFVLARPDGGCRVAVRAVRGRSGTYVGTSRYRPVGIRGWDVSVDRALDPRKEPAREALAVVERMLREVETTVPAAGLARVRPTPIFLHEHSGPGAMYHVGPEWPVAHGRTVELTQAIEISDAGLFVDMAKEQPSALLHELAHALYWQLPDAARDRVLAAGRHALAAGLYRSVARNDGTQGAAYAATDPAEYFAELSEAAYGRNDFFPFTRAELATYDLDGLAIVDELWRGFIRSPSEP